MNKTTKGVLLLAAAGGAVYLLSKGATFATTVARLDYDVAGAKFNKLDLNSNLTRCYVDVRIWNDEPSTIAVDRIVGRMYMGGELAGYIQLLEPITIKGKGEFTTIRIPGTIKSSALIKAGANAAGQLLDALASFVQNSSAPLPAFTVPSVRLELNAYKGDTIIRLPDVTINFTGA